MRVLISGAGIAGPTLAWFLAKRIPDVHVTIVEKGRNFLGQGQNIDVEGHALAALKQMGLFDRIREFHTTEIGTRFIDPCGCPCAAFPVTPGSPSLTAEFEILRGDLATVIYEATTKLSNIQYKFDTTISQIISNNDDHVQVEFSDSSETVHTFDLLVAADGQWSKTRQRSFAPEVVTVKDTAMFTAYWTLDREKGDNDWWNIYHALGSRILSIRPDPHGTMRTCVTCMPCSEVQMNEWRTASKSDPATQKAFIQSAFADAGWPKQNQRLMDSLEHAPDFYFHAIQQIRMSTWSNARIVCVGDAAYAPTPLTGAGASLAIIGPYVLAGELSRLAPGSHPGQALQVYESVLRPFVEKTQNIPWFVPGIGHPASASKRWILHNVVKAAAWLFASPLLAGKFDTSGETLESGLNMPEYGELKGS